MYYHLTLKNIIRDKWKWFQGFGMVNGTRFLKNFWGFCQI